MGRRTGHAASHSPAAHHSSIGRGYVLEERESYVVQHAPLGGQEVDSHGRFPEAKVGGHLHVTELQQNACDNLIEMRSAGLATSEGLRGTLASEGS